MNVPAEVYTAGQKHAVVLHDLSHTGLFLRFAPVVPVGAIVHIAMEPPSSPGTRVVTAGTVIHAIDQATAVATGRFHGIGVELRDPIRPGDEQFANAVTELLAKHAALARTRTRPASPSAADLAAGTPPRRVILRGDLDALDLPSLLGMLEQERKTCQLVLTREELTAAIDLVHGRIVNARSSGTDGPPHEVMMALLDWDAGDFELTTGGGAPRAPDLALSVTHLLLEHARRRDELDAAM